MGCAWVSVDMPLCSSINWDEAKELINSAALKSIHTVLMAVVVSALNTGKSFAIFAPKIDRPSKDIL